ncbi:Coenzyme F420 hydrogenase/dehydrogenase, beta subunit C-terminal domain [Bacteroides sp.]|uniref:Coenzyme F420 hydrogenase/dehydrogenase, beta subunit C-terminal domain n=1 Tax=Bacteroides sp. TaxID=29523 RepID=UPI0025C23A70|nr:Coenzyme F420 hydrogenase/dehydrogenase, beta subunit C-terminal domain [Bacteroides sp.]
MINITNPIDCCGCTACASVCAQDAIIMEPDVLGFLYPKVNVAKCTDCGLCEKVCAFNNNYDKSLNLPKPDVYGARHKDMREVESSRSGAAFIAISDYILELGGVVYGVGYKEYFCVCHKRATTKEERDEFKGSKYVQSDLTGIFRQVKQDLKSGRIVLFSGTPCQTAGLNSYVGKKLRDNLFLVDIVCHGVPGPKLWHDYIEYLEHKQGDKIRRVNFRDKQLFGWAAHRESFEFVQEDGKKIFKELFYKHIMFRHSCGVCHFCNTTRPSDITIADFWGWQKTNPDFNRDDKGVSLVFVNTEKGRKLFGIAKENLNTFTAELENVLQLNLQSPCTVHTKRMIFENDYINKGFAYVINKDYDKLCIVRRMADKAKKRIKKLFGK